MQTWMFRRGRIRWIVGHTIGRIDLHRGLAEALYRNIGRCEPFSRTAQAGMEAALTSEWRPLAQTLNVCFPVP